jgi:RNA polymerase sigma-70 factor, ECF subfamily
VESVRLADAELCSHVERGDLRAAGTWLVRRHAHEVMSLCRAMVRDLEAAEDITQEVFSRAFIGLRSFRGEASSRTWLLTIARNRCIDYLRRQAREPSQAARLEDSEPDHHPDESPLPSELVADRHQVKAALNALGEIERALVVLRFRHGLDYDELAEVFGLRAGTVRMRLSRAIARMRAILEQPPAEEPVTARRPEPLPRRPAPAGHRPPGAPAAPAFAPVPRDAFGSLVDDEETVEDLAEAPALEAEADTDETETPPPARLAMPQRRPPPAGAAAGRASLPDHIGLPARPEPGPALTPTPIAAPPPAPAPTDPFGQALDRLDPGLPIGLFERLLERISQL